MKGGVLPGRQVSIVPGWTLQPQAPSVLVTTLKGIPQVPRGLVDALHLVSKSREHEWFMLAVYTQPDVSLSHLGARACLTESRALPVFAGARWRWALGSLFLGPPGQRDLVQTVVLPPTGPAIKSSKTSPRCLCGGGLPDTLPGRGLASWGRAVGRVQPPRPPCCAPASPPPWGPRGRPCQQRARCVFSDGVRGASQCGCPRVMCGLLCCDRREPTASPGLSLLHPKQKVK